MNSRTATAGTYPRCVYCGVPTKRRLPQQPTTCASHADLVRRDPHYTQPDQWKRA